MRPLSPDDVHDALANATDDERRVLALPLDFALTDWDHHDFFAWADPRTRGRGYLFAEVGGDVHGIVVRAAEGSSRARAAMCDLCHTMQPADQVTLFSARRAGRAGDHGGSVGLYMCTDLSCHENVRLAAPLAPSEMRASVDRRIDGTRRRVESFVSDVVGAVQSRRSMA